jgi:Protein of unknown function (DUF669)
MFEFKFDSSTVEEPEIIPQGRYNFIVKEAEIKLTKKDSYAMVVFQFKIVGGPEDGRIVFDYLVVGHSEPKVAAIAQRKLKFICENCNYPKFDNVKELENKVFSAQVIHTPDDKQELTPKLKDFKPYNFGIDDIVTYAKSSKPIQQNKSMPQARPTQKPEQVDDDTPF